MCVCVSHGLNCRDLCDCNNCTNTSPDEDDVNGEELEIEGFDCDTDD